MDSNIYIAVISPIITAIVTLSAVFLTNRGNTNRLLLQLKHERKSKRDDLYRTKLEDLYILIVKYIKLLGSHYLPYLKVMEGELNYNQALDLTIESGSRDMLDFDRLQMLIDIYFPHLQESLNKLLEVRDDLNKIMNAHKNEYKQGNLDGRKFIKSTLEALDQLDKTGDRLKKEIIAKEKAI